MSFELLFDMYGDHRVPNNIVKSWHPLPIPFQWELILFDNFPPLPKSERNDLATVS